MVVAVVLIVVLMVALTFASAAFGVGRVDCE